MSTFLRVENEKIIHKKRIYKGKKENPIKIKFREIAEERKKHIQNEQIIINLQIENEKLKNEFKMLKNNKK